MAKRYWLIPLAGVGAALLYRRLRRASGPYRGASSCEFFGPMARVYDLLFSSRLDAFYARIAQRVTSQTPTGQVLDVGCGPGRLAAHIVQRAPGLTVIGIDISPDMIALARRRAEALNLSNRLHFEVADVGALPFPDNQFDLVVSTLSLHHWPDPVRGLAEIRRVLTPGGHAYIYDLADWFSRFSHQGVPQTEILAKSPFASEALGTVWSVGPVPLVTGFSLGHKELPGS